MDQRDCGNGLHCMSPRLLVSSTIHPGAAVAEISGESNGATDPSPPVEFDPDSETWIDGGTGETMDVVEDLDGTATHFQVVETSDGDQQLADLTLADSSDPMARATSLTDGTHVELSWPALDSGTTYTIYRDGQPIGTTNETSFSDDRPQIKASPALNRTSSSRNVIPASYVTGQNNVTPVAGPAVPEMTTYKVAATSDAPKSEWTSGEQTLFDESGVVPANSHVWSLEVTQPKPPSTSTSGISDVFLAMRDDDTEDLTATADAAATATAAKKLTSTTIMYRTFIRDDYIDGGKMTKLNCGYGSGYKFGGDGRGFSNSFNGVDYRTYVNANISWMSDLWTWSKKVAKTHFYKFDGTLVAEKQASDSKLDFQVKTAFDGKDRKVRGVTDAGNPFCKLGSIGAYYNLDLTRAGHYYVSGRHKAMPDHEMFIVGYRKSGATTEVLHRMKAVSPSCLVDGACSEANLETLGDY